MFRPAKRLPASVAPSLSPSSSLTSTTNADGGLRRMATLECEAQMATMVFGSCRARCSRGETATLPSCRLNEPDSAASAILSRGVKRTQQYETPQLLWVPSHKQARQAHKAGRPAHTRAKDRGACCARSPVVVPGSILKRG
ncbi:hypothetical protein Q7P37_002539 [Cladosporium fusiforme]